MSLICCNLRGKAKQGKIYRENSFSTNIVQDTQANFHIRKLLPFLQTASPGLAVTSQKLILSSFISIAAALVQQTKGELLKMYMIDSFIKTNPQK